MSINISVHDGTFIQYVANFVENKLEMMIDDGNSQIITILFEGLLTFEFTEILKYNIILDVNEISFEKFFDLHKDDFEEKKKYAWPIMYDTKDTLIAYMLDNNYHCFVVYASLGLSGFVLAQTMTFSKK